MATNYFSFQGQVYIGKKNTDGTPKALFYVGNSPEVNIQFETSTILHKESTSCSRLIDRILETEVKVTLKIVLEELLSTNLEKALRSTAVAVTGSSVTNEALTGSTPAVGDYYRTKFTDLSSIVVKDSAGSPATLTLGTHYEVTSAKYGLIKLLNLGSFTTPFTINYTYASQTIYPFFNTSRTDFYIVVDLCNSATDNAKYRLELFDVQLEPTKDFAIINDAFGRFELDGSALYDTNLGADANFGNFGRLIPIS